jgi:ABC-type multidrug transport system ATPase subunit
MLLLGANGAGKSTLLRLMAGHIRPRRGSIEVDGRLGYLPQHVPRLPRFVVLEQVAYVGWLSGMTTTAARQAAARTLDLVGLGRHVASRVSTLSGGELARMGIASALLGDPDIILLDEPSASLDPVARHEVRSTLTSVAELGVSIISTSHTATDFGPPYSRIVVLDRGAVCFDGPRREFAGGHHRHPAVAALAEALRPRRWDVVDDD